MKSHRLTTEANLDVEEIVGYIFNLNPVAAYRFLDELEQMLDLLTQHPLIGRPRPELGESLRSFPVGNYLVFYTTESEGIHIMRVVFGGRDLSEVFRRSQ